MGCDGGTKALQRKYLRLKTHEDKKEITPEEAEAARWLYCALSGEELQEPVYILNSSIANIKTEFY